MAGSRQVVAVVDDDRSMCQAISRLLSAGGFQARTYLSGEAFLSDGAGDRPDCLVLDLHMPGLSGFEVRERLRESDPELPVIFITAHDAEETRDMADAGGCAAYLRKPFPGKALLDAVRTTLTPGRGG